MNSGDNYHLYVGGTSGVFKGIKIDKTKCIIQNIQNLVTIAANDEITTMSWDDDQEKDILIACGGKGNRSVKVYDRNCSAFTCSFCCNNGAGKINGISRYDGAILTAVESGEVKLWRFKEEDEIIIKAGENLKRMRHSKMNKNIIATGGNEHKLKLFDLERQAQVFIEKNVSHDWLEMRVPVWISDVDFLPNTEQVVTVGKYGHVRLYDPKTQRRPVINLEIKDEPLTTFAFTPREKQIIVGSGKGKMNLVDLRKPAKVLNTYKGFVGGVTGIACSKIEPYIASVGLDRYVRIHHMDTKMLLKKIYLTSKLSCMLLRSDVSLPVEDKEIENSVQVHNNSNGEQNDIEQAERVQVNADNDAEYDMLFDKMQVISNKEDRKSIERKRRRTKDDSLLDNETVSRKSLPNKLKTPRSKKIKSNRLRKSM
ncbi:PREDICTED: WD repeat-containing protein 74 [Dufourea novaeangliae]|uniref:WD repeat-containing protein 74 n=1 Tax=Dufourea novaeangliae TaxID=178035 RepID=A0A154PFA3_DUFNO|nr:PREDICTED: WD repeat-containing protein 74 [Dufourea novaeangliae]KZC10124.1 WD repeat-containing protein 74 [Dufourea novaeangliae]